MLMLREPSVKSVTHQERDPVHIARVKATRAPEASRNTNDMKTMMIVERLPSVDPKEIVGSQVIVVHAAPAIVTAITSLLLGTIAITMKTSTSDDVMTMHIIESLAMIRMKMTSIILVAKETRTETVETGGSVVTETMKRIAVAVGMSATTAAGMTSQEARRAMFGDAVRAIHLMGKIIDLVKGTQTFMMNLALLGTLIERSLVRERVCLPPLLSL